MNLRNETSFLDSGRESPAVSSRHGVRPARLTSMFRKVLIAYMSVIVVAFSGLTFAVQIEVRHFLVAQKLRVLTQEADAILPLLERVNGNPKLYPAYNDIVARYKRTDDTAVNLLLVKNSNLKKIERLTSQLVSRTEMLNSTAVERVLSGHDVQLVGPFSSSQRESTLIVGVPIMSGQTVIGALFLHTPVQGLQMQQITQLMILIAGPIMLLSVLVLYFTSRRFSRPLIQMNRAVQAMGKGNFSARVQIASTDEVGQLGETFNQLATDLQRLETMRKDLIANVSHELRTPLTSVRGFIQGVLDGVIPAAEEKHYLTIARDELNRLNHLLNTMLDLSAIESGRITINETAVGWNSVVTAVFQQLQIRASAKGLTLSVVSQIEDTLTIWGDPERLSQVVFNLVDNAIRHTETGEISIHSSVTNHKLEIQVRDTGEGITPEVIDHIWERFYTGSSSRNGGDRSGLGLTIARLLVERMNGRIEVESLPGMGTTFTVWFPVLR